MKKILAIALILVMLLSLVACGGEQEEPVVEEPVDTLPDVVGVWEISGEGNFILFYDDMTWETVNNKGDVLDSGEFSYDGETLTAAIGGAMVSFGWSETGDLYSEEDVILLTRLCGLDDQGYEDFLTFLVSNQSYFEQMGHEVNYVFGDGAVYMEKGAMVMANAGQYYEIMPTTVSLELDTFNDTQDGYVEVEFTQVTYFDGEDFPDFIYDVKHFDYGANCGLYDAYTGYNLPASTTYGNTERGDNYFYFEYESQGRTICVDYNYSTEWEKESDGSKVFTRHVFIRMPADYDGLVFAVTEAHEDFATFALKSSDDEKVIGPMDDAELENAIICRVNTIEN